MQIEDCRDMPALFEKDDKTVWVLESFCAGPSCRMREIKTGNVESFGLNGLTARSFKKIEVPDSVRNLLT